MRIVFGEVITGGTHLRIPLVAEARALAHGYGRLSVSFRIHPLIPVGGTLPLLVLGALSSTFPLEVVLLPLVLSALATFVLTIHAVDLEESRAKQPRPPGEPTGPVLTGPGGETVDTNEAAPRGPTETGETSDQGSSAPAAGA